MKGKKLDLPRTACKELIAAALGQHAIEAANHLLRTITFLKVRQPTVCNSVRSAYRPYPTSLPTAAILTPDAPVYPGVFGSLAKQMIWGTKH